MVFNRCTEKKNLNKKIFFQVTQFKIIFIIAIYNLVMPYNIPFDCVFINTETKKELVTTRADLTKNLDGLSFKLKGILSFLKLKIR
jgi:hypothetical protein